MKVLIVGAVAEIKVGNVHLVEQTDIVVPATRGKCI